MRECLGQKHQAACPGCRCLQVCTLQVCTYPHVYLAGVPCRCVPTHCKPRSSTQPVPCHSLHHHDFSPAHRPYVLEGVPWVMQRLPQAAAAAAPACSCCFSTAAAAACCPRCRLLLEAVPAPRTEVEGATFVLAGGAEIPAGVQSGGGRGPVHACVCVCVGVGG